MSVVDDLSNILNAVYGRDVRQSIHDAIEHCWQATSEGLQGEYLIREFFIYGTVCNDGKDICFLIPFREADRKLVWIDNNTTKNMTVRDNGTVISVGEGDGVVFSYETNLLGINMTATKSTGWGLTNNSIVSVEFSFIMEVRG